MKTQFPVHSIKRTVLWLSVLLALPSLKAATTTTWQDGTANNGTYTWETGANWDNGVPTSASFKSVINHSTGALTITTADSTPYTVTTPNFIVNSGSLTFKLGLGSNFTASGAAVINNATTDVTKMVFDVNGSTLDFSSIPYSDAFAKYFTVKSTKADGSGTIKLGQIGGAWRIAVQNNVTLNITGAAGNTFTSTTFSAGSTLWMSAAGNSGLNGATGTGTFGNLIVGNSANANLTNLTLYQNTTFRVGGNLTLNKGTTANQDSTLTFGNNLVYLYVGGNFTDVGGSANSTVQNYVTTGGGSALIGFNGGAATQRTVSIGRTGLTNNFVVGENITTPGNIGLAKNLATTGSFTMYRGSRLNVAAFTLTAGSLILADDAVGNHLTIADTFGTTNGLITTSGNLSLNTFNLELTFDGTSWTNGSNLLLFHYGGTFTGTLALGTITYNGPGTITSLGTLLNSGGNIYLQGVNVTPVPEPSTVF
ncbi:MAG: hypothetical protein ABI443_05630, partial [Chthoniobacterales bacterium]